MALLESDFLYGPGSGEVLLGGVGVYLWVAAEHMLVPVGRRGLAITHICSCKQPLMDGWRCPGAL